MAPSADALMVDASVAIKWHLIMADSKRYQRIKSLPEVVWIGGYQAARRE